MSITELGNRIDGLTRAVSSLAESHPVSICATISDLGDSSLTLLQAIPIVLQVGGDDVLASFFDANINASGDNDQDAFANLRELIAHRFKRLESLPAAQLGIEPQRQLLVLKNFIKAAN